MLQCIICKENFVGKRKHTQYCSKRCKKKAEYLRAKEKRKRACSFCGELFKAGSKNTQYCSQACVNRATANPPIIKQCEWCKKDFQASFIKRKRRFCSKSCSTQHTNANRNEEEVRKKISETKKQQFASGEVVHPWTGKRHTEETKSKIGRTRIEMGVARGENNPMFGKRGELSPNHGIKRSDKTRELMSIQKAKQWINGKYNGVDLGNHYKRGTHSSTKLNRDIHYRSSWEKIVYETLDNDEDIVTYVPEPYSIRYLYDRPRRYIPDILIIYKDGAQKLIEIKPEYLVSAKKNQAKFKAARAFCKSRNILFEVWTERTIKNLTI
tara:strand:+ start:51950 stop:52924 length:975 start_codon:yes stop_codon:yes gene_type:complete